MAMTPRDLQRTPFGSAVRAAGGGRGSVTCAGVLAHCAAATALSSCAGVAELNYRITGEARLYQVEQAVETFPVTGCGALHPAHAAARSVKPASFDDADLGADPIPGYYLAGGEGAAGGRSLAVVLNRCFVKHLEEAGKAELFAYVEVEDGSGTKPVRNVFFRDDYQPAGAMLNFQDRIIYGPTEFRGRPITIRFYVYELDKAETEAASAVVEALAGGAKGLGRPYGLVADLLADVVRTLMQTNIDDREFFHEVTLMPVAGTVENSPPSAVTLRTGQFVIVKKELGRHVTPDALWEFEDELAMCLDRDGDKVCDDEWPSIVARSGELYIRRDLKQAVHDHARRHEQGWGWFRRPNPMQRRLNTYLHKSPEEREIDAQSLLHYLGSRSYELLDETLKNAGITYRPTPPVCAPADPPPLARYCPYRSKSYLTFSIVDHLEPEDSAVLAELSEATALEIDRTINAHLDTEALGRRMADLHKGALDAIIAFITEKELAKAPTTEQKHTVAGRLKRAYAAQGDVIDEVLARFLERLRPQGPIGNRVGVSAGAPLRRQTTCEEGESQ